MKAILFAVGGLILGGLLSSVIWGISATILLPILQGLFTLVMAGGGAYLGYNYVKREELGNDSDWQR
jgi:threonine/homoserine/homoserine lactone efflux protein